MNRINKMQKPCQSRILQIGFGVCPNLTRLYLWAWEIIEQQNYSQTNENSLKHTTSWWGLRKYFFCYLIDEIILKSFLWVLKKCFNRNNKSTCKEKEIKMRDLIYFEKNIRCLKLLLYSYLHITKKNIDIV